MSGTNQRWNLNTFVWTDENRLPGFRGLVNSWFEIHRTFCEEGQPNFSWDWGNHERPQIGLLANAVTLIGGLSLQEGWIEKESEAKYAGRYDLWLRLPPLKSQNDYYIEAKQKYLDMEGSLAGCSQVIGREMKSAGKSAANLKVKEKVVSAAFLTLMFKNDTLDFLERNTRELFAYICTENGVRYEYDTVAAIWMGAAEFELCRHEREVSHPGWKQDCFGMLFVTRRMDR